MRSLSISSTFLMVAFVDATFAALPTRGITATMAAVKKAIKPITTRISISENPDRWPTGRRLFGREEVLGRLIGARSKMSPGFAVRPKGSRRSTLDHAFRRTFDLLTPNGP